MAEPEHIGELADAKLENLKDNSSSEAKQHGGAREGAGRPKGSENATTKERRASLERFKDRVEKHADRLFNAQANLATGEQYLFVVITETNKQGKSTRRTEIVTDHETIKAYLDETLDVGDDEYYYISTKPANNMAIDSLLNRAFGTPQKSIDLTSKGASILDRMDDKDVQRIAGALGAALSGTDDDNPAE
jgi:hypothetical protein